MFKSGALIGGLFSKCQVMHTSIYNCLFNSLRVAINHECEDIFHFALHAHSNDIGEVLGNLVDAEFQAVLLLSQFHLHVSPPPSSPVEDGDGSSDGGLNYLLQDLNDTMDA